MFLLLVKKARRYVRLSVQRVTELLAVICRSAVVGILNGTYKVMFCRYWMVTAFLPLWTIIIIV